MNDGAEPDPWAVYTSTPNILHPHLCQLPFTLFGVEGQINQDKRLLFTLTGLSRTNYFWKSDSAVSPVPAAEPKGPQASTPLSSLFFRFFTPSHRGFALRGNYGMLKARVQVFDLRLKLAFAYAAPWIVKWSFIRLFHLPNNIVLIS